MGNVDKLLNVKNKATISSDWVDAITLLDDNTLKKLKDLKVKDKNILNERKDYANSNYFEYYETKLLDNPVILIIYDKKTYQLPWECNSSLEAFYLVMNYLIDIIKPNASNSSLPKKDNT